MKEQINKTETSSNRGRILGVQGRWTAFVDWITALDRRKRLIFFFLLGGFVSVVSFTLAFFFRFDLSSFDRAPSAWGYLWLRALPMVIIIRLGVFFLFGLHRTFWRFASVREKWPAIIAVTLSSFWILAAVLIWWQGDFPLSVFVIDGLLCLLLLAAVPYTRRSSFG
jgi:FlaA1/EpsC-like NDP-sugar epimerase